ncbi:integrin alpha-X-like [Scyliorhinus torazame]|uniref:integrin alpha-X-like n=1 Tax=Scyliorhinus torazame TaxID=75743 RepID=UPI003B58BD52
MRHPLSHILPGFCALLASECFNIDMDSPRIFNGTGEEAFGQRVLQFRGESENWIIVTAPSETGPGRLYGCSVSNTSCQDISPSGELGNASLTTVAASATQLVACAPSVAQPCASNIHVSGSCYLFDNQLRTLGQVNPGKEACPIVMLDVVFLFDGSNSLSKQDLENNKRFMLSMIESSDHDTMHFAVVQYSAFQRIELSFNNFTDPKTDLKSTINTIQLMESVTLTATGILFVIDQVFTAKAGARQGATKMLIVITDGLRTDGDADLEQTIEYTKKKKVIRCAIGVGDVFKSNRKAEKELESIASSPDYLIKVKSYNDLHNIFEGMKSKIYNIEGTQSSSNQSSFEQEMSQSGFSALVTEDAIILGSVGSYDWSGGVMELSGNTTTFMNVSKSHSDMKDAYLGYSVTAAHLGNRTLYVVGAPRHQHKGKVVVFERGDDGTAWEPRQHIHGEQIGSYFGSELCSLDLNGDGETDLLLIGAPLYHGHRIGGIVIVCTLSAEVCVEILFYHRISFFSLGFTATCCSPIIFCTGTNSLLCQHHCGSFGVQLLQTEVC